MKFGYIRVSTREQNLDRQMRAILKEGVSSRNIYADKSSGKSLNGKKFKNMLRRIKAGDEVYVKSIDRLGRNYEEIIEVWNLITKEKKVDIIILDFPLLDTRERVDGLTGKFISDMVLQILSYVAQIERENIHQRQKEGIVEAKRRGVRFGRPKKEKPCNFEDVFRKWQQKEISLREGSRLLDVSPSMFSTWIKEKI